ncbi:hypothetical protein [Mangrovibacterium lignilyticum]|uniref:hypothetical protein n=1 Tax=Mangrovibacterium lignilyticum TaxID=2668052 RepID=UPI0013D32456|nr:hypothetical protein [Mangrovibacterium lignilyticum]
MRLTFTILILLLSFQNLFSQADSAFIVLDFGDHVDTIGKYKIPYSKTYYYKADLTPWATLKDSGSYNGQNEKIGFWREYPIDTTVLNSNTNIRTRTSLSEIYKPKIVKLEGKYLNGEKEGIWKKYSANIRTRPFFWSLETTTEYKDNMKNGEKIDFDPFSKDTTMIIIYKNDEPIKQIK